MVHAEVTVLAPERLRTSIDSVTNETLGKHHPIHPVWLSWLENFVMLITPLTPLEWFERGGIVGSFLSQIADRRYSLKRFILADTDHRWRFHLPLPSVSVPKEVLRQLKVSLFLTGPFKKVEVIGQVKRGVWLIQTVWGSGEEAFECITGKGEIRPCAKSTFERAWRQGLSPMEQAFLRFAGMWADRIEMKKSTDWVRGLREGWGQRNYKGE